jgi:hypothetical protein
MFRYTKSNKISNSHRLVISWSGFLQTNVNVKSVRIGRPAGSSVMNERENRISKYVVIGAGPDGGEVLLCSRVMSVRSLNSSKC